MNRPKILNQTETQLLLNCRRRCCICFGFDRDHRIKQGQIAHLDGDSQNNKIENLAFICLAHHDQYDTKTSQSKGLTISEVKNFRSELEQFITDNWNRPINKNDEIKHDIFTGSYTRGNEFAGADLEVTYLGGKLIHVKGFATWGRTREYGPSTGQLDFVSEIDTNRVTFADTLFDEEYRVELEFLGDKLIANESYLVGYFGLNVSFGGEYYKLT